MKKKKIPKFKTIQEEAEFWDTHDITDNWEGTKEVEIKFAKKLQHILGIRLSANTIDQLDKKGEEIGVGASTLARIWILEKLKESDEKEKVAVDKPKTATGHVSL